MLKVIVCALGSCVLSTAQVFNRRLTRLQYGAVVKHYASKPEVTGSSPASDKLFGTHAVDKQARWFFGAVRKSRSHAAEYSRMRTRFVCIMVCLYVVWLVELAGERVQSGKEVLTATHKYKHHFCIDHFCKSFFPFASSVLDI